MSSPFRNGKGQNGTPPTPGQRVMCRDAEWLVTRVMPYTMTGQREHHFAIYCVGADSLVRGHEAIFLTQLDELVPVDPRDTELIPDRSSGHRLSRLFLEARLRRMPATGIEPDLKGMGVFQEMPFQVETVRHALRQLRPRLLLADAVGLGKTIEVGMILTELMRRNRANRILVLAKKSMLAQFQAELWNRFTIPLVRLDSEGIARLRLRIPAGKNPFEVYRRIIISMDTLKNVARYEHFLKSTRWDVVVIDEAHNVAGASIPERNQSYRLARLLSRRADSMLLTTATPHNGKRETFGRLISLLDPAIIPDPNLREYGPQEISQFFKMRFKEDIRDQAGEMLSERRVIPLERTSRQASEKEERIFSILSDMRRAAMGKQEGKQARASSGLITYGLYKTFLSSPEACAATADKRISNLITHAPDSPELAWIQRLKETIASLFLGESTRFKLLLQALHDIGWKGEKSAHRVLVFTESRRTQDALAAAISKAYGLPFSLKHEKQPQQTIAAIHGGLPDVHLMKTVEAFATASSPIRMLIATDVASEGINLHHACHQVIHYDLPWSIITLVQRNGRIDRLGQKYPPELRYLLVDTKQTTLAGDRDIFQRLISKVEEINRLRQSGESVLKLYDQEKEEAFVAEEGLLKGNAKIFDQASANESAEAATLEKILREACAMGASPGEPQQAQDAGDSRAEEGGRARLFSDRDFLLEGYRYLRKHSDQQYRPLEVTDQTITLNPPPDLKRRLGAPDKQGDVIFGATAIPAEAWPEDGYFKLTHLPDRMQMAIEAARNTSGHWAGEQFCSERHPILQWLAERLVMEIPKGAAPMVGTPHLDPGVLCFCFIGQLSSKGGTPLVADAHAFLYKPGGTMENRSLWDVLSMAKLESTATQDVDLEMRAIRPLLHAAVEASLERMRSLKDQHVKMHRPLIEREEKRLEQWLRERKEMLSPQGKLFDDGKPKTKAQRRIEEMEDYVRDRRRNWRETHFDTADEPSTQLVLVIHGSGG